MTPREQADTLIKDAQLVTMWGGDTGEIAKEIAKDEASEIILKKINELHYLSKVDTAPNQLENLRAWMDELKYWYDVVMELRK